jgi:hypothetical protein
MTVLTPEDIGEWLVDRQKSFFAWYLQFLKVPGKGDTAANPSIETLVEVAAHSYALQLAIVLISYEGCVDDTRLLEGDKTGLPKIEAVVERIQSAARKKCEPDIIFGSVSFNPTPVAGCVLNDDAIFPRFALLYASFFTGIATLEHVRPPLYRTARALLVPPGAQDLTHSTLIPSVLAYICAHERMLTDPQAYLTLMGRTYKRWNEYFSTFQSRLIEFAGRRRPAL